MSVFEAKAELAKIPTEPGVYRYFSEEGEIIYVGKAKNLKNRVSSYFVKNHPDRKTRRLVSQIRRIEYTIVHTEFDALLLENQLIKRYQPRFNILLRDDKTYPFIKVFNEPFPRVETSRRLDKKTGTFYGPFANARSMYNLLDMFRELYTLRTCNLNLTPENIEAGKFKVCMEYHLKRCKGPCEGRQSLEDYDREVASIHQILKGQLSIPQNYFKENMIAAAEKMEFEKAHEWKMKLETLQSFQSKSTVINPKIGNVDVVAIVSDEDAAYVNYLKIVNGYIMAAQTLEVKKKLDEPDDEILALVLFEMRTTYESDAKEIISNIDITTDFKAEITIPKIGDKRSLLDMALKNVHFFRKEKAERQMIESSATTNRRDRVLIKLKADLQLKSLPRHIECFDNSNIQGTNPVAAMVCFKEGRPSKKDYRHFSIKTVIGPNDFASMHEVVTRRYTRLLEEQAELPDLIVVDGGKGQLSAACDALKALKLYGKIPIVGIAKRLEEIYFPEDTLPLYIDKKSESLRLIQQIRDEAHRFAITYHRDKRSRNAFVSELENIEGIGKKTAANLLKEFRGVKAIREADVERIAQFVGKDKAQKIKEYFAAIEQ
ncbi:excinuclease ABC subunit UvrC [Runella salmonicolor]|uniref:UvrABC system protein C n=1 Tax=Runella salmonicolor TaxID=2950278 RepID=A0ABT1FIC9_9BACT|nr:excinuclease ABC subunit UvrC [Runella salmonicolor]MCP1381516.1 excinuclease ABC subunit UvrC [Runella salmonicolor]